MEQGRGVFAVCIIKYVLRRVCAIKCLKKKNIVEAEKIISSKIKIVMRIA